MGEGEWMQKSLMKTSTSEKQVLECIDEQLVNVENSEWKYGCH